MAVPVGMVFRRSVPLGAGQPCTSCRGPTARVQRYSYGTLLILPFMSGPSQVIDVCTRCKAESPVAKPWPKLPRRPFLHAWGWTLPAAVLAVYLGTLVAQKAARESARAYRQLPGGTQLAVFCSSGGGVQFKADTESHSAALAVNRAGQSWSENPKLKMYFGTNIEVFRGSPRRVVICSRSPEISDADDASRDRLYDALQAAAAETLQTKDEITLLVGGPMTLSAEIHRSADGVWSRRVGSNLQPQLALVPFAESARRGK